VSQAFALAAHAALASAGAAFFDAYDGQLFVGVVPAVPCKVFIDQATEEMGEFGQAVVGQHFVTFAGGNVSPAAAALLVANGATYRLERKVDGDGVTQRWSATRG